MTGDSLRGRGNLTINQPDYKIKLVSVAGGAIKIKDELTFAFDILAQQEDG